MATSTITNTILNALGTAIVGVKVRVRLMPCAGFKITTGTEVAQRYDTETDNNGTWSAALEQNINITPANTYYEVEEQIPAAFGGAKKWIIQVGASNQSLQAAQVSPAPDVATSNFLTQAAADARYQQLGGYGVVGDITAIDPNDAGSAGVATTVARSDHQHATAGMPWGRMTNGGVIVSADQTGITTTVDLTGLTVTITAVAGRRYRVTWLIALAQVASTGTQIIDLSADGASTRVAYRGGVLAGTVETIAGSLEVTGLAAGARIIKLRGSTTAGTLTIGNNANVNGRLTVEDIGV